MTGVAAASIVDAVEEFIRARFAVPASDTRFSRDVDLWDEGYVDSLGVVELIAFVETTFALQLPTSVLFHPEFRTVNGIGKLTRQLLEASDADGVGGLNPCPAANH